MSRLRPVRSMASLMSVCTTRPVVPTFWQMPEKVARAACNVQHLAAFAQVGHHHGVGLPGAVQAAGHQVVHHVVPGRNRVKHAAYALCFFFSSTDWNPKWVVLIGSC